VREAPSIQAITFDVGGTLIEPWPSVGHVYAEVAARHGFGGLSVELLNRQFQAAWRAATRFDYTRKGWERLVRGTFKGLVPGPVSFFSELYDRFSEPRAWRVFDDVRPALEALSSLGVRLGVISNWDDRLLPLLERLRLQDHFEHFAISCDVGSTKPSPAIFHHAAAGLGLSPGAILHVGDSADADVEGARAAGFQARRLRRDVRQFSDGAIHSLAELRSVLSGSD
jgi:putative hydrolase of the HAD superfamily